MLVRIIAYLIAVGIPALSVYIIFTQDLFGTGKRTTVLACLVWGVFGAFGLAYAFNQFLVIDTLGVSFETLSTRIAPVMEEVFKSMILWYFIRQPRFRYFIDGAVYGFAAGIGFAMSENIFYIANDSSGATLVLATSRVLSAALMHATASSVVGISMGLSRRQAGWRKIALPLGGMVFAFVVHFIYNNLLFALEGSGATLLLTAIGIGVGGGVMIAYFINTGLAEEKKRFNETLGLDTGISRAERTAVQQFGSEGLMAVLGEMEAMFGTQQARSIEKLFVIQANIGILRNNLRSPVGERLRTAWQKEVDELNAEMDAIRQSLGSYIMTLLRSLLPEDEDAVWDDLVPQVAEYDPNHVHAFDMFMVASELSDTVPPEQIERISNRIHKMELFKKVELSDLDNLSRAITIRNFISGELLFNQGDPGDSMYLIDRGYVDVFIAENSGERVLRTFQAGDVVGELALLDGQPRSAGARANGPLRVMILNRQHFLMFIQSRPKVILAFLEFLSEKVRYTTKAVTNEEENIEVQELSEDTAGYEIAPAVSDTVAASDTPFLGVFGRLNQALDEIESRDKKKRDSQS